MAKRGRKTKKAKDSKGYLDSNKSNATPYKVIRGNKITMEGVSGKIYAVPIDKEGKAGEGRLMNPGENHEFEGASHIIEVPETQMAQPGGAVSTGLGGRRRSSRGNPSRQETNTPPSNNTDMLNFDFDYQSKALNTPVGYTPTEENIEEVEPTTDTNSLTNDTSMGENIFDNQPSLDDFNDSNFDISQGADYEFSDPSLSPNVQGENNLSGDPTDTPEGIDPTEKIQFANPYGGVDIPTASNILGKSLAYEGDQTGANTARGVGSGLKLLAGLGRNVMSGYGQQKANQYAVDEYNKNQTGVNRNQNKEFKQQGGTTKYINQNPSTPTLQKGGKVKASDLLTGAFTTGDPSQAPNVEVEKGEHIKDNQTGQVQEVLGKKHSQGGEEMNLPDHNVLSDYNKIGGDLAKKYRDEYDVKVKAKDTFSTAFDKVLKKTGYTSKVDELSKVIEKSEKEQEKTEEVNSEATTGINMQFLSGKINDLNEEIKPLEQLKSQVFEHMFTDQQGKKTLKELQEEGSEEVPKAAGGLSTDPTESRKRFKNWINNLRGAGFEGDVNLDAEDLDAEAAKVQSWMRENKPEEVIRYFTENGQPITAKGVDLIKENNPNLFSRAGISPNKQSAEYSSEEKEALRNVMQEEGLYTDEFILEQFNDNKFSHRSPQVSVGMDSEPRNNYPSLEGDLMPSYYDQSEPSDTTTPDTEPEGYEGNTEGGNTNTMLLPEQYTMPPSAMQPHRLAEITPREAEAKLISPRTQLEEVNRQYLSSKEAINSLPDSQRRAALAQLNSQVQQNINQVMSQTNRANAQIEGQNEERNIARKSQADLVNERFAEDYERKTYTAMDNTETDVRNYFNALNKKNVANFNTVQSANLMNQMYDNFQYDGMGGVKQTGKAPDLSKMTDYYLGLGASEDEAVELAKQEREKEKEKKKAKRGRKTK